MVLRRLGFQAFETWAVARLLASPTFHRVVRSAHKKVHETRHSKIPSDLERDELSQNSRIFQYFKEELRDQFWGRPRR